MYSIEGAGQRILFWGSIFGRVPQGPQGQQKFEKKLLAHFGEYRKDRRDRSIRK